MSRSLLIRIGGDTLTKLEGAARRRYAEALHLVNDEPLGALYLFGYTIEMRLKAAYYRLINVPPQWNLDHALAPGSSGPRQQAQQQVKLLLGPGAPNQVGHHLVGWAGLLVSTRAGHALGPFAAGFQRQLTDRVQAAGEQWSETLRYRTNRPYNDELNAVVDAARWIKANYRRLWS
jgi:hypothetical protein